MQNPTITVASLLVPLVRGVFGVNGAYFLKGFQQLLEVILYNSQLAQHSPIEEANSA